MDVTPVSGSAPTPGVEPDLGALAETIGVFHFQFAMGLLAQGALLNHTVEQAFGEENHLEKAKNIDIA